MLGPAGLTSHTTPQATQAPTVARPATPARGRHAAGPPTVTVPEPPGATATQPTERPRRGRHVADLATSLRSAAFTNTQGHTHVPDPYDGPVTWEKPQAPSPQGPAATTTRAVTRRARVRLAPTPVGRLSTTPPPTRPQEGPQPAPRGVHDGDRGIHPATGTSGPVPQDGVHAAPPAGAHSGPAVTASPAVPTDLAAPAGTTTDPTGPGPITDTDTASPEAVADLTIFAPSVIAASQPVPPFGRQTYATPYGPCAISSPTIGTDPLARTSTPLARRLALPLTATGLLLALGVGLGYALGTGIL